MRLVAVTILALQPLVMAGVANVEFGPDFPKSRTLTSSATPSTVSANTASLTSSPNPVIDCTDVSKSIDPSCWDTLGMAGWLVRWNATTQTCNQTEIWSICFLREAYGTPGCDCSKLGSVSCVAPQLGAVPHDAHIFYAAYNIYGAQHCPVEVSPSVADSCSSYGAILQCLANSPLRHKLPARYQ